MTEDSPPSTATHVASHHELIGVLCAAWARLELSIDSATWILSENNQDVGLSACITAQFSSIHQRIKSVIALSRYHKLDETLIKRLTTFHGHVGVVADKRNRIVHDAWSLNFSEPEMKINQWNLGIGKDVTSMYRSAPISEIQSTIAKVRELDREFDLIRSDLFPAYHASKETVTK